MVVLLAVAMLALAPGATAATLPLGDNLTTAKPHLGRLLTCGSQVSVESPLAPWIKGGRIDLRRKPGVSGWRQQPSRVRRQQLGRYYRIEANNLPGHTGNFPAQGRAATFDPWPVGLRPAQLRVDLARQMRPNRQAHCVADVVGIGRDGTLIAAALQGGLDPLAHQMLDRCDGGLDSNGFYRRYRLVRCRSTEGLLGWALDGAPILAASEGGRRLTSRQLDACHGHYGQVDGHRRYHYHATSDFPYTVGCLRGRPAVPQLRGTVTVSSRPALTPAWRPQIDNYTVACPDRRLRLRLRADRPNTITLKGQSPWSGKKTISVNLDPGQAFSFRVNFAGQSSSKTIRCLPDDFPRFHAERHGRAGFGVFLATPGPLFGATPYAIAFDSNGTPIWWQRANAGAFDAKLIDADTIAWSRHFAGHRGGYSIEPSSAYELRDLRGNLRRLVTTNSGPIDEHDFLVLGNGNYLAASYLPRSGADLQHYRGPAAATVMDYVIEELNTSGQTVWQWSSKDHIGLNESSSWWPFILSWKQPLLDGTLAYDPVHGNSLEDDGHGGVIFSARHLDAIYRIDRSSGQISWKLGGSPTAASLRIDSQRQPLLSAQHDARLLANNRLSLLDNGSGPARPPAVRLFELLPEQGRARELLSFSDAYVPNSACCGSARLLENGHWLVDWGGGAPRISETTKTGISLFSLRFANNGFSYRASPAAISAEKLIAAMEQQALANKRAPLSN